MKTKVNWSDPSFYLPLLLLFDFIRSQPLKTSRAFWAKKSILGDHYLECRWRHQPANKPIPRCLFQTAWMMCWKMCQVKQQLERELAPVSQYRKRMEAAMVSETPKNLPIWLQVVDCWCESVGVWEAHMKNNIKKIAGTPVEASTQTNTHRRSLKSPISMDFDMRLLST